MPLSVFICVHLWQILLASRPKKELKEISHRWTQMKTDPHQEPLCLSPDRGFIVCLWPNPSVEAHPGEGRSFLSDRSPAPARLSGRRSAAPSREAAYRH